jgi:hypothetical protein
LSSQYSFQWFRQQEEERKNELVQEDTPQERHGEETTPPLQPVIETADEGSGGEQPKNTELPPGDDVAEEANRKIAEIEPEESEPNLQGISKPLRLQLIPDLEKELAKKDALSEWNEMIAEAERAVEQEKEKEDHEIIDSASENEKQAMAAWKHDHPDSSLKLQRRLLEKGAIDRLPWENYLRPKADFSDDEAAEEAAKWALEQVEKKKQDDQGEITWMEHDEQGNQIIKSKNAYQQNAEQNERTIWQRIQNAKK